ncbi:MAG: GNAT family N-acetyltransferase [Bacteroidales bacterium]|jgi:ribosomal protein S18 acetylase RimI-like enzyme|nr:GNAT family N-acetyltransferase [Bacteroidales bacterium]HPH53948.1 GNAT family N-acetyltransferase [Bacteroidales bacterium]
MDIIKVRVARPGDRKRLTDFQVQMALETEGQELDRRIVSQGVKSVLDDPQKASYFVAELEGVEGIVGCLMITDEWSDWRNGWVWWIQSLYVQPEYRKRGVFTALLEHVWMIVDSTSDVKGIRLYVDKNNTRARALYEAIGMSGEHYITYELMKE